MTIDVRKHRVVKIPQEPPELPPSQRHGNTKIEASPALRFIQHSVEHGSSKIETAFRGVQPHGTRSTSLPSTCSPPTAHLSSRISHKRNQDPCPHALLQSGVQDKYTRPCSFRALGAISPVTTVRQQAQTARYRKVRYTPYPPRPSVRLMG